MTFNALFTDDDNENAEVHIDKEHHTSLGSNLPNNEDSVTEFKKLKKEMNTVECLHRSSSFDQFKVKSNREMMLLSWTHGGSGGGSFWEEGDDFGVDVLRFLTCLTDILGFLEKLDWWFEQDIDDEGDEDEEGEGASKYDAMIELPKYVCNASEGFKKHNQLLKLMQFLMGLDDSYLQIRSTILSREVLPDVRSAYATISSEESHRVAVDSIVGYPADFRKKKASQSLRNKMYSVGKSLSSGFTDEQMATLISLIKDNKVEKNVQANIAVDYGNDADSSDDLVATQNEKVATLEENVFSKEMDALLRNVTWELVELPEGRKAIGSKWIYKIKFKSSEEVVYTKPPEGYFPSDNKVCRLKKSLYGLKQDPRQWNAKLTSTLIENGFSQSNIFEIEKFKVYLKSKFMIKDLEKLKYFLGIEVIDTDKGIYLKQRKYVIDLLYGYGMLACKPAKTPLMSKLVISNEASENDPLLENFMHSPLSSHLKIAFKILRYLKSFPDLGIYIARTSGMFLNAYSDADWAKCIVTRKSVPDILTKGLDTIQYMELVKRLVSLAGTAQNALPTLKDLKFWSAEEKKTRKIDHLARSLLIQGLPNDIYSLIDSNETAKDLWDALERQMRGSEYGEQYRKAAFLYELHCLIALRKMPVDLAFAVDFQSCV
nr:ribonuclease H-like domain-containing protein [Tanacetum cinerariifolium]